MLLTFSCRADVACATLKLDTKKPSLKALSMLPLNHNLLGAIFNHGLPAEQGLQAQVVHAANWLAAYCHRLATGLLTQSQQVVLPSTQWPTGGFVHNNRVYHDKQELVAFHHEAVRALVSVWDEFPTYYNLEDVLSVPLNYHKVKADLANLGAAFAELGQLVQREGLKAVPGYKVSTQQHLVDEWAHKDEQKLVIRHLSTDNRVAPAKYVSRELDGLPANYDQGASLFLALRSAKFSQLELVKGAIKNGYRFIVCEIDRDLPEIVKLVDAHNAEHVSQTLHLWYVNDTLLALHALAKYHRVLFNPQVVAVTGSSGKTTIKDLTARLVSAQVANALSKAERVWAGVSYLRNLYLADTPLVKKLAKEASVQAQNPSTWALKCNLQEQDWPEVYAESLKLWKTLQSQATNLPEEQRLPYKALEEGFALFVERHKANRKTNSASETQVPLRDSTLVATHGNLNNHIGVPLSLLQITENTKVAIIEHGANHKYEIAFSTATSLPNIAYLNNVQHAHTAAFGGIEGVAEAKAEIACNTIPHNYLLAAQNLSHAPEQYSEPARAYAQLRQDYISWTLALLPKRYQNFLAPKLKLTDKALESYERHHWGEVNAVNLFNNDDANSWQNTKLFLDYSLTRKVFGNGENLAKDSFHNLFVKAWQDNYAAIDAGLPFNQKLPLALDVLKTKGIGKTSSVKTLNPLGYTNLGLKDVDNNVNLYFPGNLVIATGVDHRIQHDGRLLGELTVEQRGVFKRSPELQASVGFSASEPATQDLSNLGTPGYRPELSFKLVVGKDFLVDKNVIGQAQDYAYNKDPHYEKVVKNPPAIDKFAGSTTTEERAAQNRNSYISDYVNQALKTSQELVSQQELDLSEKVEQARKAYEQAQAAAQVAQQKALSQDSFSGPLAGGLVARTGNALAEAAAKAQREYEKALRDLQQVKKSSESTLAYATYNVKAPVVGAHNANNIAGVVGICSALGLSLQETIASLAQLEYKSNPGRNAFYKVGNVTIIDDAYNANPGSLAAALEQLNSGFPRTAQKTAVLGPLAEVEDRDLVEIYSRVLYQHALTKHNFSFLTHHKWAVEGYLPGDYTSPLWSALRYVPMLSYQPLLHKYAQDALAQEKQAKANHEPTQVQSLYFSETLATKSPEQKVKAVLLKSLTNFPPPSLALTAAKNLEATAKFYQERASFKQHQAQLDAQLAAALAANNYASAASLQQQLSLLTPPTRPNYHNLLLLRPPVETQDASGFRKQLLSLDEKALRDAAATSVGYSFIKTYKALTAESLAAKAEKSTFTRDLVEQAVKVVYHYADTAKYPAPQYQAVFNNYPVAVVKVEPYDKDGFFEYAKEALKEVAAAAQPHQVGKQQVPGKAQVVLFKGSRAGQLDQLVAWFRDYLAKQ